MLSWQTSSGVAMGKDGDDSFPALVFPAAAVWQPQSGHIDPTSICWSPAMCKPCQVLGAKTCMGQTAPVPCSWEIWPLDQPSSSPAMWFGVRSPKPRTFEALEEFPAKAALHTKLVGAALNPSCVPSQLWRVNLGPLRNDQRGSGGSWNGGVSGRSEGPHMVTVSSSL